MLEDDDPFGGQTDLDFEDEGEYWRQARQTSYRRGHQLDAWFVAERDLAQTVACPDCKAHPNDTCVLVGSKPPRELTHFPAHTKRIIAARQKGQT